MVEVTFHRRLPVLDGQDLTVRTHQIPVALDDVQRHHFVVAHSGRRVPRAGRLEDKAARGGDPVVFDVFPTPAIV